jgi:cysteinyl-tRNA synthetase
MHCRHLQVEGSKMAKSAGNFFTLRDLMEKGWTGREVRYALISVKYREPLNFTFEGLAAARSALQRLDEWTARLRENAGQETSESPVEGLEAFGEALDDDLIISAALASVFEAILLTNRKMDESALSAAEARSLLTWLDRVNSILALEAETEKIPESVQALLTRRAEARASKEWKLSDTLRDEILALGWMVKDTKDGQKLSPAPRLSAPTQGGMRLAGARHSASMRVPGNASTWRQGCVITCAKAGSRNPRHGRRKCPASSAPAASAASVLTCPC